MCGKLWHKEVEVQTRIRSDTWGEDKRKRYFVSIPRELTPELGWKVGDRLYLAEYGRETRVRMSQVWREKVPGDNQGTPLTLRYRQGTFYISLPRAFVDYFRLETG
jgi:hypothetical protein